METWLGNGNAVVQETAAGESEGAAGYEDGEQGAVSRRQRAQAEAKKGPKKRVKRKPKRLRIRFRRRIFPTRISMEMRRICQIYRGKVTFLNFWATWCGYCVEEMGDIQELYEEYGRNEGDVVILGAASPATLENPNTSEQSEEAVIQFLEENGYTYPVIMDTDGQMFWNYGISFPAQYVYDSAGRQCIRVGAGSAVQGRYEEHH